MTPDDAGEPGRGCAVAAVRRPGRVLAGAGPDETDVLDPESDERRAVIRAGWEIAFDGMELEP